MPKFETELIGRGVIARDTLCCRFARPHDFTFTAGQAVTIAMPSLVDADPKGPRRTFSIVSAPSEPHIEIATRLRGSAFKRTLADSPLGTRVEIRGPSGRFALQDGNDPAVMIAGGIGVTPFISMIRQAHIASERNVTLFYSVRTPEDAAFLDELESAALHTPSIRVIATVTASTAAPVGWRGEVGRFDVASISQTVSDLLRATYYIAGPPAMVREMKASLETAGVGATSIHTDEFFGY